MRSPGFAGPRGSASGGGAPAAVVPRGPPQVACYARAARTSRLCDTLALATTVSGLRDAKPRHLGTVSALTGLRVLHVHASSVRGQRADRRVCKPSTPA